MIYYDDYYTHQFKYMKKLLYKIGLSPNEVQIYIYSLRHENTTPTLLASSLGLDRSTVYFWLKKLKDKGLISYKISKRRRYIIASNPSSSLSQLVEEQDKRAKVADKALSELLPQLEKYTNGDNKIGGQTRVEYYTGMEGFRRAVPIFAKSKKPIYWIGSIDFIFSIVSKDKWFKKYTTWRMNIGANSYAITDKKSVTNDKFTSPLGFRHYRFFKDGYTLPSTLALVGDTVMFAFKRGDSNEGLGVIVIHDTLVASLIYNLFQELWNRMDPKKEN